MFFQVTNAVTRALAQHGIGGAASPLTTTNITNVPLTYVGLLSTVLESVVAPLNEPSYFVDTTGNFENIRHMTGVGSKHELISGNLSALTKSCSDTNLLPVMDVSLNSNISKPLSEAVDGDLKSMVVETVGELANTSLLGLNNPALDSLIAHRSGIQLKPEASTPVLSSSKSMTNNIVSPMIKPILSNPSLATSIVPLDMVIVEQCEQLGFARLAIIEAVLHLWKV